MFFQNKYTVRKAAILHALQYPLTPTMSRSKIQEESETPEGICTVSSSHLHRSLPKDSLFPSHCATSLVEHCPASSCPHDNEHFPISQCLQRSCCRQSKKASSCTNCRFHTEQNHASDVCCEMHHMHPICSTFLNCPHSEASHRYHRNCSCISSHCSNIPSPNHSRSFSQANIYANQSVFDNSHKNVTSENEGSHIDSWATSDNSCSSHVCRERLTSKHSLARRSRSVERSTERHLSHRSRKTTSKSIDGPSIPKQKSFESIQSASPEEIKNIYKRHTSETAENSKSSVSVACHQSTSPSSCKSGNVSNDQNPVPAPPPPPLKSTSPTKAQRRRSKALMVDRFSRIFFPITFGFLNTIYWLIFWLYL